MDANEILKFCLKKGFLLDKELLDLFNESEDFETTKLIIEKIGQHTSKKIITMNLFNENKEKFQDILLNLPEERKRTAERLKIKLGLSIEISKEVLAEKDVGAEKQIILEDSLSKVKVVSMATILSKKIGVKDFVDHFRNRFSEMKDILQGRGELNNLISINKISTNRNGFSLIGLISNKRITKNKNILFEIEDLTGKVVALVNQNKPDLYKKAEEVALDSVIGFNCSGNQEIVFVNDLFFPDSKLHERKNSPFDESALFIGDSHIGSDKFMEENFMKFIDYINCKVPNTPEAEKIKYIFFVGDIVAGVGIYPGQENDLLIPDIEEQYSYAAELLGKIRKDIKIILSPGNHDSVRIMEPQPILDEKYAWMLYDIKNLILTTNPATVNIGAKKDFQGFNVMTYHGYSYHYYANNISRLMREKAVHDPVKIMKYLLKNRHLSPTHSSTLYFPSKEDTNFIKNIPDILVSGHTHKSGVLYYNNILNLSVSSWESKTAFQEKMGNEPDFCKVPMFNLKTRELKILDFE